MIWFSDCTKVLFELSSIWTYVVLIDEFAYMDAMKQKEKREKKQGKKNNTRKEDIMKIMQEKETKQWQDFEGERHRLS